MADSKSILRPDICVIGAGSGGLTVAAAAASFGVPVVLIEKGLMGGDCLNYGCVPSKALIAAARHAHDMRHGKLFGIADVEPQIDFAAVQRHVEAVIGAIAPNDSEERFTRLGVTVIRAPASFIDDRTVQAGSQQIRARRFVIATGSSPKVPDVPGLAEAGFLTNETIFDLAERPDHLGIIGAGPVGIELAQAYARLGVRVTVFEAGQAFGREDPDLAAIVLAALKRDGVSLMTGAELASVERGGDGIDVRGEQARKPFELVVSHLLVATGRQANVEGLGLDKAGVVFTERGVTVDAGLRTSNKRVYAIGDVAGGAQFTHVAGYHGGLVLRPLLFRLKARTRPEILPRVTYSDPEIASVGLTEREAKDKRQRFRVLTWTFAENDRAQAEHATEGLIKVVAGRGGRVLGASIAGRNAGELIHVWALAVSKGLKVSDIAGYVAPYPTMGEIGKRAAVTYFQGATRNVFVRALLRVLRLFG